MDQNTRRTVSICFQVDYAPVGAGAVRSGVGTLASPWCLTSPQILTGVVRSGVGTLASPWCLTSPQILFDYAPVGAGAVWSGVGTLASPWCLISNPVDAFWKCSGEACPRQVLNVHDLNGFDITSPQILTGII